MLRYKTETRPGLVALYDIRPGNGAVNSYNPGARTGQNKLSPLTRRRSATQLSRENRRLNDFGRSFVVQTAEVINNRVMDVSHGIWLT